MNNKNDLNGQELHTLKLKLDLDVGLVKAASEEELIEESSVDSCHFANPAERLFPTHTKEATERSIVYFFGGDRDFTYPVEEVQERLYKAARFWEIPNHYYTVKSASESFVETPEAITEYALDGKLPVSSEEQIIKSAKALTEQRNSLSRSDRSEAAMNILKSAAILDLDMSVLGKSRVQLEIMSGINIKPRTKIAKALNNRAASFARLGVGSDIYKTAAVAVIDCDDDGLDEICNLLDGFEHSKTASRTRNSINPIEELFFAAVPNDTSISLKNGHTVLMSKIKSASLAPFYVLGTTVPLEVTNEAGKLDTIKTAKFLERIPKEDCDLFEKALEQCR